MGNLKLALMAIGRLFYELDLFRAKQAKRDKEQRANEIKQNPNAVAAERFGDADGRASLAVERFGNSAKRFGDAAGRVRVNKSD